MSENIDIDEAKLDAEKKHCGATEAHNQELTAALRFANERVAALEAENERLRELVENAFIEGLDGKTIWSCSNARNALEQGDET
jgi:hypothetical protein